MSAPASHDPLPPGQLVAVFGPTGVGKTSVALALAEQLRAQGGDAVAVSADAFQVYRGLEILSGAPTDAEQARLEHRLVSCVSLQERFSAGQFASLAHAAIDEILASGRVPIVVGGTGLYLRAALTTLELRPELPAAVRERWATRLYSEGPNALHAELARAAAWAAAPIDPADGHRIVRALGLLETGELREPTGENALWTAATRQPTRLIGLVREREELYVRIDARVDAMVASGAAAEVAVADVGGASETARKAIGFRHLLAGDVEGMKRDTRRFAKRQLTWMRKLAGVQMVEIDDRDPASVAAEVLGKTLAP